MIERELKFWPVDRKRLIPRLEELGRLVLSTELKNTYFTFAGVNEDLLFRLRNFGSNSLLCAKGDRFPTDQKARPEFETDVDDPDMVLEFVRYIGGSICAGPECRWREMYDLGMGIEVSIDSFAHPRIPDYVEVEAPDEDRILTTARKLGLLRQGVQSAAITFAELAKLFGVSFDELVVPLRQEVIRSRQHLSEQFRVERPTGNSETVYAFRAPHGSVRIDDTETSARVKFDGREFAAADASAVAGFLSLADLPRTDLEN